ncbi:MAG: methyltransferase domain-containing protein [bacterium]
MLKAYYREWGTRQTQDELRDRIHWILRQVTGKKVLDVGCSQGLVPLLLGRAGFDVLGLDVFAGAIETAHSNLAGESDAVKERVRFVLQDIHEFESDERFDTAVAGELLEHMIDPTRTVAAIHRVLREGGRLIVTVPFGVHPDTDHKQTLYLSDLTRLLEPTFAIEWLDVEHNFICCVAKRTAAGSALQPEEVAHEELLRTSERAFFSIEQRYLDRAEELRNLAAGLTRKKEEAERLGQKETAAALAREAAARAEVEHLTSEAERLTSESGRLKSEVGRLRNEVERMLLQEESARAEADHQRALVRQARFRAESAAARQKTLEARAQQLYDQLHRARRSVGFRISRASSLAIREGNPVKVPRRWVELFRGPDEVLDKLALKAAPPASPTNPGPPVRRAHPSRERE